MHWIESEEITPDPLDDVLIVDESDGEPIVVMAFVDRHGHWFISDSFTPEIPPPRYWMPLPALPASPTAHQETPT